MKLWQTPIGPNLPGTTEILHNWPVWPCVSSQEKPASVYSQKILEAFISHQQQQKRVYNDREKAKALPDLNEGQSILYIMTQFDWLPRKVTQKGPEPRGYIVSTPTDTT